MQSTKFDNLPVVFENVRFERTTNIPKQGLKIFRHQFEAVNVKCKQKCRVNLENTSNLFLGHLEFHVSIHRATGHFEVSESNAIVVTGIVRVPDDIEKEKMSVSAFNNDTEIAESDPLPMTKKDFYKKLRLRGYHYKGLFKNIVSCNTDGW